MTFTTATVRDSLNIRVMRTLEELLKDRPPDARPADTDLVLDRMRLGADDRDQLAPSWASCSTPATRAASRSEADNKVMDVTVTGITDQGSKLLGE